MGEAMSEPPKFRVYRGNLDPTLAGRKAVWDACQEQFKFFMPFKGTHLGAIYFIAGADMVKIGFSTNLDQRLESLQSGSPVKLVVEAFIQGSLMQEQILHGVFGEFRRHGEWFERSAPIELAIRQAKTNCEPEDIMRSRLLEVRAARVATQAASPAKLAPVQPPLNVLSFRPKAEPS